jgi:hypothetical protein
MKPPQSHCGCGNPSPRRGVCRSYLRGTNSAAGGFTPPPSSERPNWAVSHCTRVADLQCALDIFRRSLGTVCPEVFNVSCQWEMARVCGFERTIFTTAPGDLVAALLPAGRGACMTRPPAPKPWSWCGLGAAIFAPMNGAPLMRCLVGRRIQGPGVWVVEAIWLILEVVRHCRCLGNVWGFALWRQPRWRLKRF